MKLRVIIIINKRQKINKIKKRKKKLLEKKFPTAATKSLFIIAMTKIFKTAFLFKNKSIPYNLNKLR